MFFKKQKKKLLKKCHFNEEAAELSGALSRVFALPAFRHPGYVPPKTTRLIPVFKAFISSISHLLSKYEKQKKNNNILKIHNSLFFIIFCNKYNYLNFVVRSLNFEPATVCLPPLAIYFELIRVPLELNIWNRKNNKSDSKQFSLWLR